MLTIQRHIARLESLKRAIRRQKVRKETGEHTAVVSVLLSRGVVGARDQRPQFRTFHGCLLLVLMLILQVLEQYL